MIRVLVSLLFSFLGVSMAQASEFNDEACNIFVVEAGNVITGGRGNFLSAKVAVSKALIEKDFKNYKVRIVESEDVEATQVEDVGNYLVFTFDEYAEGIEYHGNSAYVLAYIDNGIDKLFDRNDSVYLVRQYNWQYTQPNCKY